jgi:hypothetical protein
MVGFSFSHANRLDVTLIAAQEIGVDQKRIDQLLKSYFTQEVESLHKLAKNR